MIRPSFVLAGVVGLLCTLIGGCGNKPAPTRQDAFVLIDKPSFVKTWDVQLPLHSGDSIKGIYFLDGTVHVLTNLNFDHAVKGDSGDLLYQNQIGTPDATLSGGPTLVTDGIVFPTTHTLELFTRDGNFRRSVNVNYNITNQAVGNRNYVYVGMDFKRGCLAQADVTQDILPVQWTFLTFGTVDGPVAISENVIYCASEDGSVRACLEDRTPFWPLLADSTFSTGSKIVSGVVVDNRSCYFSTTAGKLYCLDKNTGRLRWQYIAGMDLNYGPQVTETAVYQFVPGAGLAAIDKTTKMTIESQEAAVEAPFHNPRWTLPGAGRILAEDAQFVYVVLGRPNEVRGLAAVDKASGEVAFATHRRDLIAVTSDPKGALFYGVSRGGLVVAMKPVVNPGSYGEIALGPQSQNDGLNSHVR
ncbi:MAG: PQQ-binding-like beta-propeller repeat protein [Tepidisphaeraceae bacterium]